MTTKVRLHQDIGIIELKGTLASGPAEQALVDEVERVLECGHRHILIDVGRASGAGAAPISALMSALARTREAGGMLKLVNVTRGFDDLQVIVALYDHFEVVESEDEALESFGRERVRTQREVAGHRLTAELA
jgi:anti-sigma B factor antagonist